MKETKQKNTRGKVSTRTKEMVWAALHTTTGRLYVVETNVPNPVIKIGATLAPITNNDEDRYAFIECYLLTGWRDQRISKFMEQELSS